MYFDQILIRMGVDAKSVVTGLNAVGAQVKGWAGNLVEELRGKIGGFLAAGVVFEGFTKVREEIQEISRLSEELGVSTNFIQSLQLKSQQMGMSLESISRPFVFFNRQIGEAKRGIPDAIRQLHDLGVITNNNELSTLTYAQAMSRLKAQFDKVGDSAKQDALLNEAFSRSSYQMAFIFRQSQDELNRMNEGNFFQKFSPSAISDFQSLWNTVKQVTYGTGATATNWLDRTLVTPIRDTARELGIISNLGLKEAILHPDKVHEQMELTEQAAEVDGKRIDAAADDIQVQEERTQLLAKQSELLERQLELTSELADRGKSSVEEMAEDYRRKLGLPKVRLYGTTPREAAAYHIQNLEQRSTVAFEQGNDALYNQLQSEALRVRKSNPWLKLSDRDPFERTNTELQTINSQLTPVKEAAQLVLTEHHTPK